MRVERYGVKGTEAHGVFFTEATIPAARSLGRVQAASDRQNTNLDELKRRLARDVTAMGGNCLMGFQYGQKGTVFSFSSTRITASGIAADMPPG